MTIQYFEDTDTLYVVFKDAEVQDTTDLDENTLVEFDAQGNLVSMTIEHARELGRQCRVRWTMVCERN
jgi:uncharacterized protein YuzE